MNEKLTSVRRRQTTPLFEFAGIFLILASCASNDSAARTQTLTETAVTVPSGAFAIPAILADGTKVGNMVLGKTTLDDAMRMFPQQARYEGSPHAPNGYPTVRVGNNPPRPTLVYQPWESMYALFFGGQNRLVIISELGSELIFPSLGLAKEATIQDAIQKYPQLKETSHDGGYVELQGEIKPNIALMILYEQGSDKPGQVALALISAGTQGGGSPVSARSFFDLLDTGTPQEIQAAIDKGADANFHTSSDFTPLMEAASYNRDPEVVAVLVKAGADVNAQDKRDSTALAYAAWHNPDPAMTSALLSAGASVTIRSTQGQIPLMEAAALCKNPAVITLLLEAGSDVNARDNHGGSPLSFAVSVNTNAEVTRILLKARADVTARDSLGYTPLMWASDNENLEVTAELLKAGAEVNTRDNKGATPLMRGAGYCKNPEVIAALLNAGADANLQDQDGTTALMWAAEHNANPQVILNLLRAGADVKTRDKAGKSALDHAQRNPGLKGTEVLKQLAASQ